VRLFPLNAAPHLFFLADVLSDYSATNRYLLVCWKQSSFTIDSMSDSKKQFSDPFVRNRLFPDASKLFDFTPVSLDVALKNGLVAVDTNVLLIPYTTGPASLEEIGRAYERLSAGEQLRIPGQVAREFADLRADKLKTIYQQISLKRKTSVERSAYRLLEGIPEYAEVTKRESELHADLDEYRKAVSKLLDTVANWHWNDPVSQIYQKYFKSSVVVDIELERVALLEDLKYRQEHRIPPGYKDAANEHSGVGDYLIWKTLLKIGSDESRHLVFVSGDEKTDWRYQSENTALYPRFELLDEYRTASNGKTFLIISFSELLKKFDAPGPVVDDVRSSEAVAAAIDVKSLQHRQSPVLKRRNQLELAVFEWLMNSNPEAAVLVGGSPHFVVSSANDTMGYEFYWHGPSVAMPTELRQQLQHARHLSQTSGMPITFIIVADGFSKAELLDLRERFRNEECPIVIGELDESQRFQVRYRLTMLNIQNA